MENVLYKKLESLSEDLKHISMKYATDQIGADDIYQVIIEKALKTCKPTDTKSYICQLATWTARNVVNAERIYLRYVTVVSDGNEDGNGGDDGNCNVLDFSEIFVDKFVATPEDRLIEAENCAELQILLASIVDQLDETNKSIISLLRENFTHQAIADNLQLSRTAVSNRVQRMRGIFQLAGLTPSFSMG